VLSISACSCFLEHVNIQCCQLSCASPFCASFVLVPVRSIPSRHHMQPNMLSLPVPFCCSCFSGGHRLDGTLLYATGFPPDSNYEKPNSIYTNYLGCPPGQGLVATDGVHTVQGRIGFSQGRCQNCSRGSFNMAADLSNCSCTPANFASLFDMPGAQSWRSSFCCPHGRHLLHPKNI
jgi:hypothetical protein